VTLMASLIHLLYALIHVVLFGQVLMLYRRERSWLQLLLLVSIAGLAYDNAIVAVGHLIGAGDLLMGLNWPRFVLHAVTTPLLGMIGLAVSRSALTDWAWQRRGTISFWAISLSALSWALYADLWGLQLVVNNELGLVRYVDGGPGGPPLAAITPMTLLMFSGIGLWVRDRWSWLFLGSLVMFTAAAFASGLGLVANLGEILLMVSLVATLKRYPTLSRGDYETQRTRMSDSDRLAAAEAQRARKRAMAAWNRNLSWGIALVLAIGTAAYYGPGWGWNFFAGWVDPFFNNLFLILFFVHTTASFYFYGVPKLRRNIRVAHIYIGYAVFVFTMVSQSVIGMEPLHLITYILNWLFIGMHVALGLRFMLRRVTHQQIEPLLEVTVSRRLTAGNGD
jgi:hypothetical protein